MLNSLLNIQNLSINFATDRGIIKALSDISFSVNKNEIVAIVGESGSGKSVTSLSILQLLPSSVTKYESGEILFSEDGINEINILTCSNQQIQQIRGKKIAMIFQEPMTSLNPVFTCGNQVTESILQHHSISKEIAKKTAIEWFKKVDLPDAEKMFDKYPHELSGGQKQRVMIAMAMCCKPQLLICDEPTTALDVTVQKSILNLIKNLQQETGMGVIFITHDLGVVSEIAHKVVVMYKGRIVETGTNKQIFHQPKHTYTKALLACRPAQYDKGTRLPTVHDIIKNISSEDEKKQQSSFSYKKNEKDIVAIVDQITVQFPKSKNILGKTLSYNKAVDHVSLTVYRNETLGIVGESGCGKTTLGRTILQLIPTNEGRILFPEFDIKKDKKNFRKNAQIIFQDPYSSLNPKIKIGDTILEVLNVHHILHSKTERIQKVKELLEKVGLEANHYHRYPHEFSGGQRQRIVIARALALSPAFIVCDESVAALDVSVQAQVLNLLNDLKEEFNFTILFISHDLSVVKYFCDRIIVMQNGKIVEEGTADEVYHHPQNSYTQNLIAAIPQIK
ncbi:MAG: ABC transporter ATP-binding protein [Chitinophagaceae bacterium]|nr:MAG: ABC transporter ATP-binding protein [Chitinophagaceae bacterium]